MIALSLNIRHGGGPRIRLLLDWILRRSPDVIVLPEWRNNHAGNQIKQTLNRSGFAVATAARGSENGVLIASKYLGETIRTTPNGTEKGELLLAHVSPSLRLLGAYFPNGKAKASFFESCIAEAIRNADVPFLLVGDLNTGRNDLDRQGRGARFSCAELFSALQSEAKLVDLWRIEHGIRQEWTWRSPVNGFRIDHAFGNRALHERFPSIGCAYEHEPRNIGITDHSALIIRIG